MSCIICDIIYSAQHAMGIIILIDAGDAPPCYVQRSGEKALNICM